MLKLIRQRQTSSLIILFLKRQLEKIELGTKRLLRAEKLTVAVEFVHCDDHEIS